MFEVNTFVSSASVGSVTYSGSAWNTYDGGPLDGMNMHILITAVQGNVNALFRVAGLLPDGVTWIPLAYDALGPVNTVGERNIHFALGFNGGGTSCIQYRLECLPNERPDGGASLNSSSLSGQSFYPGSGSLVPNSYWSSISSSSQTGGWSYFSSQYSSSSYSYTGITIMWFRYGLTVAANG